MSCSLSFKGFNFFFMGVAFAEIEKHVNGDDCWWACGKRILVINSYRATNRQAEFMQSLYSVSSGGVFILFLDIFYLIFSLIVIFCFILCTCEKKRIRSGDTEMLSWKSITTS